MSMRFTAAINKPGFNPLGVQTSTTLYNLYAWGYNNSGQLGQGNTTSYSSPKQVGALTVWLSVSSGGYHGMAIKNDGTLWTWGSSSNGQLGLGNITSYSSPKQVGALTNWSKVSAGYVQTLAVKTDGTLWAWGANNAGQLGNGNTTKYSSPIQVGALTNWRTVFSGVYSSAAIKTDGTLWTWGGDFNTGALGLGVTTSYSSPKQVGALTNWLNIYMGQYNTTAVKTDGTLWTWGRGSQGALGLNNTTNYSSPKQVGALTTWSNSSIQYAGTGAAVRTDGTLWTWGFNSIGQLGIGNQITYSSPKQVGLLSNWSNVIVGYSGAMLATKTDGTLWGWGYNTSGQLGFGNVSYYSSPKQVGAASTWTSVSIYLYTAMGLN